MADIKTAVVKSAVATVVGFIVMKIKPYFMPKIAAALGNFGQYAPQILGFLIGIVGFYYSDRLGDYGDAVIGAIVGAFAADPVYLAPPSSPQQAMAQAASNTPNYLPELSSVPIAIIS